MKYQVKDQKFNNEREALKFWLKLGNKKKYYSVFKNNDNRVIEYRTKEITREQLNECIKGFNTINVFYKGTNKVYCYRNIDKIDFNNLDHIVLLNLRGRYGHVEGGLRIEYVDDKFIAIS